ncbi:MAG: ferric reductase-like transmembrane domain-containing protein [Planctomycetes bacterium]|nr:ferric reductase-like transmembrane domain-containing protein [Planctomycetota bacterium]
MHEKLIHTVDGYSAISILTVIAPSGVHLTIGAPLEIDGMLAWLTRHITLLVGIAAVGTIVGIGITAAYEPTATAAFITARQLYGLTALGVLLGACIIGPLAAVLPRLPGKGVLLAGRRAIGVSSCVIAIPHVACYLGPVLLQNWRELFSPGWLWVVGLVLGLLALLDLLVLAWTSRDPAVKALGGNRWKRLHRTVYVATPIVLLHAVFVGADFGFARPPTGEADYGSLITFAILTAVWLALAWLRSRGIRWPARPASPAHPSSETTP